MKIAIVSDAVYPYNIGGKEKRIYEITTRLARSGHTVTIYTMKWWGGKKMVKVENGVRLQAISPLYPLYAGERRSMKEAIFFALHCFKLIGEDFDVIDVDHMPHLVLFPLKIVTLFKRKKLFVTWNEVWGREYWKKYVGNIVGEVAYIIEMLSVKMADEIISISDETTDKLRTVLHVTQPIHTIPMGIDLEVIKQIKPAKVKSDVIYAGRLLEHKNVHVLLQSIAKLKKQFPNITCLIVGSGPEEGKLRAMVKKLGVGDNVRFLGFLENHDDLYALMKSSKVFAFPSTREGFGIAALEANACNLPVVTTSSKDNASRLLIKEGENGKVVKLDSSIMSKAIGSLLGEKTERDLGDFVKNFSWNTISQRLEQVHTV